VLHSIRARVTATAAVVLIVVLIAASLALLVLQRVQLTEQLDESLIGYAEEISLTLPATLSAVPDAPAMSASEPAPTLQPRGDDDSVIQIVSADGDVLASTANYRNRPALPSLSADASRRRYTSRLIAGEPAYRVLSMRAGDLTIHVAAPIDDIDESIGALRLGLAAAIPIVAIVLAALIWWLVGRTLQPVEEIRAEVATISGKSLHRRVPEPAGTDEINRLAVTMNSMLDRVERSSASQQRFVADASHELRSPLTRIRSELEVDLAHPETAELMATQRSVLAEAEQMQRLIDDLLTLARHDDDPAGSKRRAAFDLDDVVMREIQRMTPTGSLRIDSRGVSAAQVVGDEAQLTRAVRNVLDNAARHARAAITVTLAEDDGRVILTITDDGPGIPSEQHEQVFERFSRVDDARTRDDGGTGLGLAIARTIVEAHNGTIRVDPDHYPGARIIIEFPQST
jgi:signal transduction histidine kinase